MSIFSQLLSGKITLGQAMEEAMTWLGQTETSVVNDIKADPAVQTALNTIITDGKQALTVGADWVETALSGKLSTYAEEAAALIQKYAPEIAGVTGGPVAGALTAAGLTAIQALGQIGVAVVQHEVASFVTTAGGPAPEKPA